MIFGLLRTETDTSLFGSRIKMARSSLDPFIAAFMRSATPSSASRAVVLWRSASSCPSSAGCRFRPPRRRFRPPLSTSGSSLASPPAIGSTPRPRKKSLKPSETSDLPRNVASESVGIAASVASAAPRTSGSPSSVSIASSAICSCARGASAPRAARRRTSLATSPRLKKSRRGLRKPTSIRGS